MNRTSNKYSFCVDPYENSNNDEQTKHFSFIKNFPQFDRKDRLSPTIRKLSSAERRNSDLIESEEVIAKKDNMERVERVKKRLLNEPVESLGSSANHVFEITEGENEKIAYLKFSPDGKINVPIMEKVVTRITLILELSNFVESDIIHISPRSGQGLLILEKTKRFSSKSKMASLREIKNSSGKTNKKTLKTKRRSANIHELYKLDRIPSAISKPVAGKTLQQISKINSSSFSNFESLLTPPKNESTYYNYFIELKNEKKNKNLHREEYQFLFIEAVINSIIIGTNDAHKANIIFCIDGFYQLDQGRSLVHSNDLLVWADAIKLPYYSAFMKEGEFYTDVSDKNLAWISEFSSTVKEKLVKLKEFLYHPMQKDAEGINKLPFGWLDKASVYSALNERVTRINQWAKKSRLDNAGPVNLANLLCEVCPYQSLITYLCVVVRLLPNYLLDPAKQLGTSTDRELLAQKMWQQGMIETRQALNYPDPIEGQRCDVLTLIDQFIELGFDPEELHLLSEQDVNAPKKILYLYDTLLKKLNNYPKLSKQNAEMPPSIILLNQLSQAISNYKPNLSVTKSSELHKEFNHLINSLIEIKRAPREILKGKKSIESSFKTALWVFEKNAFFYLKTLFASTEIESVKNGKKVIEFKISLCKKAKIDYKDLSEYQTNYWLIKYLQKLCTIAKIPFYDPNQPPTFQEIDSELGFYENGAALLKSKFLSKGYFLSFYELSDTEKDPKFLDIGCTLTSINKDGGLENSPQKITVIVIEGNINFCVDNHIIPFDDFLGEMGSNPTNYELNPQHISTVEFINKLYLFDYFNSSDFGVEFFNYDDFDPDDVHQIYPSIHEYILFTERSYLFHREGTFLFYYMDKDRKMKFEKMILNQDLQFFTINNVQIDVNNFRKWANKQVPCKEFQSGRSAIKLLGGGKFSLKRDNKSYLGSFDPCELSVTINDQNKEPIHSDLSLTEFINWTVDGDISGDNKPHTITPNAPVEIMYEKVTKQRSTFEIFREALRFKGIVVFDFDECPVNAYCHFPKIHDHLVTTHGSYIMHRKNTLSLHYLDHNNKENLIKLIFNEQNQTLEFHSNKFDINQLYEWIKEKTLANYSN